ncbi:MAG: hypothetical protein ONB23_00635 [candidate division KSB1 bacterium]|nr:hypothetical protein [candidate division KSB1 bacterium]
MRRGVLFVGCLLLATMASEGAWGQGGFGGILLGAARFEVDDLNHTMARAGYQEFSADFPTIGGWGAFFGDRVLIGGSGWGMWQTRQSSTATARLAGGVGFFDLGLTIRKTRLVNLTLLTGLGGGGMELNIVPAQLETNFGRILENPRLMARLSSGQMLLKFGLQFDHLMAFAGEDQPPGVLLGLRVEYLLPFGEAEWKAEESTVHGMPDFNLQGLYVSAVIGFGAKME